MSTTSIDATAMKRAAKLGAMLAASPSLSPERQHEERKQASGVASAAAAGREMKTAVIVAGARTPFVKSFGKLRREDSIALACQAVKGLLEKTKLDPNHVDQMIMGNVVVSSASPNLAREVVIDLKLPPKIPGTTVSVACLSGLEAVAQAVLLVEHGDADCVIAGGSDSLSNGELPMPRKFTQALGKYQMGGGNKKGFAGLREMLSEAGLPNNWLPTPNSIAERSTGKTMGFHADLMAEINKIPRKDQDELAIASHRNAGVAQQKGYFQQEIVPVKNSEGKLVAADDLIRPNPNPAKVAKLGPAFRKAEDHGTVTAASSSALTDGASAVLVMSEDKARELGYATDIVVRSYAKTAIRPHPQLLLAPAIAIKQALDKAGLTLADMDLVEMHEAFAAQVLSTLAVLEQDGVGTVPRERLNPNGGSIAVGHPFAATGGRLVAAAANELRRSKKRFALISICAAGGIGGVMILENRQ